MTKSKTQSELLLAAKEIVKFPPYTNDKSMEASLPYSIAWRRLRAAIDNCERK